MHAFLVSSKTPNPHRLTGMGYQESERPGVYRSSNEVCRYVDIISLNDLTDEPHNLAFKMFASKREVRANTYDHLMARPEIPEEVVYYLKTLYEDWSDHGGPEMITNMTKEEIIERGRKLTLASMAHLPYDVRLAGIPADERLKGIPISERLKGVPASERLKGLSDEELQAFLLSDERLRDLFKSAQNQAG